RQPSRFKNLQDSVALGGAKAGAVERDRIALASHRSPIRRTIPASAATMPRMIERWRVSPRLGWAVVVGAESIAILLLLVDGALYQEQLWLREVHLLVLAVVGAAGWIGVIWRPTRLAPFLLLAPLPLVAAVFLTAFVSPYPSLSWPAAWQTAGYTGIFWL